MNAADAAKAAIVAAGIAANVAAGHGPSPAEMQKFQMEEQQRIRTQQIEQATRNAGQPTTGGR